MNDDLITKLEFTEAFSGLSKDTAPGPDMVKYSEFKNLSVDDKALQQDRFPKIGHIVASSKSPNPTRTISS